MGVLVCSYVPDLSTSSFGYPRLMRHGTALIRCGSRAEGEDLYGGEVAPVETGVDVAAVDAPLFPDDVTDTASDAVAIAPLPDFVVRCDDCPGARFFFFFFFFFPPSVAPPLVWLSVRATILPSIVCGGSGHKDELFFPWVAMGRQVAERGSTFVSCTLFLCLSWAVSQSGRSHQRSYLAEYTCSHPDHTLLSS